MLTVAALRVLLPRKHTERRSSSNGSQAELADRRVRPARAEYRAGNLAGGGVLGVLLIARRKKASVGFGDRLQKSGNADDAWARPKRIAGYKLTLRG